MTEPHFKTSQKATPYVQSLLNNGEGGEFTADKVVDAICGNFFKYHGTQTILATSPGSECEPHAHHVVREELADGRLRFLIPPLPWGHFICAPDGLPFTRSGPHKTPVSCGQFASALREVSLKAALEKSGNFVVFACVEDTDSVTANTKIGIELNHKEFKCNESKVMSVTFAAEKFMKYIDNLFNAATPVDDCVTFVVGVNDDGDVIGYDVGDVSSIQTNPPYDLTVFLSRFFPPLPSECVEIRHLPVVVFLPLKSPPRDDTQQKQFDELQAFEQLVQTKGLLEVFERTDLNSSEPRYKTADSLEQLAELKKDLKYTKVQRHVVQISVKNLSRGWIYFHTNQSTARDYKTSVKVPVTTNMYLDSLGVWLCARNTPDPTICWALKQANTRVFLSSHPDQQGNFSHAIRSAYEIESTSWKQETLSSIGRGRTLDPILVFVDLTHDPTSLSSSELSVLREGRISLKWIAYIPMRRCFETRGLLDKWLVVFNNILPRDFISSKKRAQSHVLSTSVTCLDNCVIPNSHEVAAPTDKEMLNWLSGAATISYSILWHRAPPKRELFTTIEARIDVLLSHSTPKLYSITLKKVHGGCGGTTLLKQLAVECERKHQTRVKVCFVDNGTTRSQTNDVDAFISRTNPCIVFVDENASYVSTLIPLLHKSTLTSTIICVHVEPPKDSRHDFESFELRIEPYLSPNDSRAIATYLKRFFPNANRALDALINHVSHSNNNDTLWDRHIFVLALTATKGIFIPANKLVMNIKNECDRQGPIAKEVAITMAYLAAFSSNRQRACIPTNGSLAVPPCNVPTLETILTCSLTSNDCRIAHSLFGRLLLQTFYTPSIDAILTCHSITGRTLVTIVDADLDAQEPSEKVMQLRSRARTLLIRGRADKYFSQVLAQFAYHLFCDGSVEYTTKIDQHKAVCIALLEKASSLLTDKHWPIDKGYADLQVSRIVLQWRKNIKSTWYDSWSCEQQSAVVNLSTFLRNKAIDFASLANSENETFDSACNLASTIAQCCSKNGALLSSRLAREAMDLYETLWNQRKVDESTSTRKLIEGALQYLPDAGCDANWSAARGRWQKRKSNHTELFTNDPIPSSTDIHTPEQWLTSQIQTCLN